MLKGSLDCIMDFVELVFFVVVGNLFQKMPMLLTYETHTQKSTRCNFVETVNSPNEKGCSLTLQIISKSIF